jgi:hypothetical protein
MMRKLLPYLLISTMMLALWGCDVKQGQEGEMPRVDVETESGQLPEYEIQQTQEGEMPDVDVETEGGQLPEYDVQTPDIDVGTETKEVPVPDVDVTTEEEEITVPTVDVEMPDEQQDAEKTN